MGALSRSARESRPPEVRLQKEILHAVKDLVAIGVDLIWPLDLRESTDWRRCGLRR
jgi:hypothetical protein